VREYNLLDYLKRGGFIYVDEFKRPAVECGWNVICQAQQNQGTAAAIAASITAIAVGSAAYFFGYGRQQNTLDDAIEAQAKEPSRSARLANKG